jgi:large subunit ribosomal protein L24
MRKIRKDDEVMVLTGKDKGKHGKVVRVLDNDRVIVSNINVVKRHTRPNPNRGVTGGIVDKEASIHVSNVALLNPTSNKGERVGIKRLEDGTRVRFFKKSGEVADVKVK